MPRNSQRLHPSPDEIGVVPKIVPKQTTATPNYAVTGSAGGSVGVSQGHQLAQSLSRFNPALASFGQAFYNQKMANAEGSAMQYVDELEKGVSDHAVIWKKTLKDAGADQWRNPYVYRNAIASTGANTAFKDAGKLATNLDLQQQLHGLSKTSEDFENDAIELIERGKDGVGNPFFPLKRNIEKGANKYWEAGYGPGWLKARDNLLSPYMKAHVEHQQMQVREAFFTRGKNLLTTLVDSKPEEWTANFKAFRTFISSEYGGFPDREFGYTQTVFDQIVAPIFSDLARNPDNDVNIQATLSKVMSMSRTNANGGNVQLFPKQADLSKMKHGVNTYADLLNDLQKMELDAANFQQTKEQVQLQTLTEKLKPILKHWNTIKEEPKWKEFFTEHGIEGMDDPTEDRNWKKLASVLAQHPDYQMSHKESEAATMRVFLDAFELAKYALDDFDVKRFETAAKAQDAISAHMTAFISDASDTLLDELQGEINSAVGGATDLLTIKRDFLAALDPVKLQESFFAKNPSVPRNAVPLLSVIKQHVNKSVDASGILAGRIVLQTANQYLTDPASSPQDLSTLLDRVRDAGYEIDDADLEADLGAIEKLLKERIDNSPYYKQTKENLTDLLTQGLSAVHNEAIVEILYLMGKSPPDVNAVNLVTSIDDEKWTAAQATKGWLVPMIHQIYNEEADKILRTYDPNLKKTSWEDKGKSEAIKNTLAKISNMQGAVRSKYESFMKKNPAGAAAMEEAAKAFLSPEDIKSLNTMRSFEDQFRFGGGSVDGFADTFDNKDMLADPAKALEFTAGPAGQRRYNQLKVSKQARLKSKQALETELYKSINEYRILTSRPDADEGEVKAARERMQSAETRYKHHYIAFEGVPWKRLSSDQGVTIPIAGRLYGEEWKFTPFTSAGLNRADKGGQGEEIVINPHIDGVNLETTLIYESPEDMENIGNMLNTFETEQGGIEAEIDAEAAPEELQAYAKVILSLHGENILAKDPEERRRAHGRLSALNQGQIAMMYTRHPDKMGEVQDMYEDQALRQFSGGASTSFQGQEFTENQKDWVTSTLAQRDSVIDKNYTVEKGLTGKQTITMFGQLVGGSENISPTTYRIEGNRVVGRGVGDARQKKKPIEVLAQMMALTTVGLQRPLTHEQAQDERPGWEIGDTGGLVDGTTLGLDSRYNELNRTTLTQGKMDKVQAEIPRILNLLRSKKAEPELAQLFNRLVQSEGDFFENFYGEKNTFGIKPLLIPHAPAEPFIGRYRVTEENTRPKVWRNTNPTPSLTRPEAGPDVGSNVGAVDDKALPLPVKPKAPTTSGGSGKPDGDPYAGYKEMLLTPKARGEFETYIDNVINRLGPFDRYRMMQDFIEANPPIGDEPWMQEFRKGQLPATTPRSKSKKP